MRGRVELTALASDLVQGFHKHLDQLAHKKSFLYSVYVIILIGLNALEFIKIFILFHILFTTYNTTNSIDCHNLFNKYKYIF